MSFNDDMNKRCERRNSRRVESCVDEDKLRYRIFQGKNINDYTQRAKKNEARNKDICNGGQLIALFVSSETGTSC